MKADLTIVKVGGHVLDDPVKADRFVDNFAGMKGCKLLVHGGGKRASEMAGALGVKTEMVEGRRITSAETLEVVTMVYAGLINKGVVSLLQSKGCDAIGLSGADANIISCTKRPPGKVDYGFAGDIQGINERRMTQLLNLNLTPVLCPITHDSRGQLLNTNADTIAAWVAAAMSVTFRVKLVYCFEKPGVLADPEDGDSVIKMIGFKDFEKQKSDGTIHSGMIPKMENCFRALRSGVSGIIIGSPEVLSGQTEIYTTIAL